MWAAYSGGGAVGAGEGAEAWCAGWARVGRAALPYSLRLLPGTLALLPDTLQSVIPHTHFYTIIIKFLVRY